MREVTLFWKRTRLAELDIGGITDIFTQLEFVSYVKRVPKDIRIILKANFSEGHSPKDMKELHFLELLEVILEPKDSSDSYILLARINHSVSNLNARTNGTSAAPGCRLDGEGLTYIIQGPPLKLRLVSTLARLISRPDRISARSLDFNSTLDRSVLNTKQLKLAKYAYDRGYFDVPKRVRISDLATEIGLARATISEHLAKIESILMDDMFSSFDEIYTDPKVVKSLIETVVLESESDELDITDNMLYILNNIKKSITTQLGDLTEDLYEGITGEEMIELAVKEHQENLSYIEDVIEEKLKSSSK